MNNQEVLEQFAASLQSVSRHMRHTSSNASSQQVTRVQWLLLRHLKKWGGRTIGQLAEYLNVRSSTMSQMIDRLEKANLVAREQDRTDARVKSVHLTDAGEELIRLSEEHWVSELSGPFEAFSSEERTQLVDLMKKLVDHLPTR
ncbi:MAG: MarR family transcriptional regulator [Paenibacillaceae bacterium]|jgi:DNA-binding MarR family transcriptional regulator|nr:MarR family transcriptional regulator [Paenibacillaceae bacterium]